MFIVSMRTAPRQCVRVYGSSGSLTVCRPFNAYSDIPLKLEADDGDGPRIMRRGPADHQYGLMPNAFAAALGEGTPMSIPASNAVNDMKVIDVLCRSGASGNWESV